jgi:DNA-directed RNA polymerase specialized sigma24 family protein
MTEVTALHDVENVEALVTDLLNRQLARRGAYLAPDQREDLEQELVVEALVLARSFKPGHVRFVTYASFLLERRYVDWCRRTLGDSRARTPRPAVVSLDALADACGGELPFIVEGHEEEVVDRVTFA